LAKSLPFDNQYFISVNTHSKEKTWFYKTVFQSNFKNIGGLLTNLQMQHHKVENVELINNIGFQKSRWELVYMFDIYANITKNLKVNLISRQEYIDWNLISQSPNSVDNKSSLKTIRDYILPKMFVFSVFYRPIHYLNWDIKSSFTRNYRYPTLNDLYFQVGGNPNLKPEKGYTYEIGSTFEKSISNWNFTTQLTAYYSWIDDWILWRPQTKGNWTPMNVQFVEARGVEIEYKINYKSNKFKYNISANYAYLKTTAEKNYSSNNQFILGRQLPYIPQHSADFSFKIDYKKWSIQYLFQFNSKRYATLQNSVYYLSTLPNYFMSDILIERKMNYKKLEFTIQGKVLNLLNENYRTVLGRNMPMRHYECWLNIQF
jgi:iron complex outermembrane receptor protein